MKNYPRITVILFLFGMAASGYGQEYIPAPVREERYDGIKKLSEQ